MLGPILCLLQIYIFKNKIFMVGSINGFCTTALYVLGPEKVKKDEKEIEYIYIFIEYFSWLRDLCCVFI